MPLKSATTSTTGANPAKGCNNVTCPCGCRNNNSPATRPNTREARGSIVPLGFFFFGTSFLGFSAQSTLDGTQTGQPCASKNFSPCLPRAEVLALASVTEDINEQTF